MTKTPNSHAKNKRQYNEAFHVRTLRGHPYFDQIIKRIVAGNSVQSIARWCELSARKADGVKKLSFYTWRLYVSTLRNRIRPLLKDLEILDPRPELYEDLVDQIRRDNALPIEDKESETQTPLRKISTSVKIATDEVEAEKILKFAFLVQLDRVSELLKREEKTGVLEKHGRKEILVMVAIGAALGKLELGQHFLRAGKVYADSGKPPVKGSQDKQENCDPTKWDPNPLAGETNMTVQT